MFVQSVKSLREGSITRHCKQGVILNPATPALSPDEKGLVQAALNGDLQSVRDFLGKGISPNVRDSETYSLGLEWNITPLMCAAAGGHLEVVRALLDAGADVSAASESHKQDGGPGSQALHHALANNHVQIATLLLDAGADPNAVGRYGRTPLTSAIYAMSLECVRLMLQRGADVKLKPKRKDYAPPLYVAASKINSTTSMVTRNGKFVPEISEVWERKEDVIEIFRLLLAAGADPNASGPRNSSPLHTLVAGKQMPDELRLPLVELLLNAGAQPDLADKDGWTARRTAELYKNARIIDLLKGPVQPLKPAATASKAQPKSSASSGVSVGAAHFLKFISDGQDEWAILAIKAPLDDVTNAFSKLTKSKSVKRDVPRKTDAEKLDEIAPAVAVVKIADNPWAIVLRSLFHLNESILLQLTESTAALSSQLKTRAIVFANHDASDAPDITVFENGKSRGDPIEISDDSAADEFFRNEGIYLPACYPKAKGKRAWLCIETMSADRIERVDLIEL
jgi:ankyrin repeat protein